MAGNTDTRMRLRHDGSIDTGHYMARGRLARSEAAHDMLRGSADAPRRRGWLGLLLTSTR
jgi:hypothetical protein